MLNSLFVTLSYWARVRDRGSVRVRVRVRVRVLESSYVNSILGSPVIGSRDTLNSKNFCFLFHCSISVQLFLVDYYQKKC